MSENENMVHQGTAVLVPQQVERLPLAEVKTACSYVKQLLDDVMKEDLHYGTIPGCGKKRALFKAGADKIKQALNLYPEFEGWDSPIDLGSGHVAYRIKTTMRTLIGNFLVATGIGYCSSMEKKYRYTVGELTSTGNPVPPDYWTFRKTDPAKALKLIGGEGFRVKKITSDEGTGRWEICVAGEPMERTDIADVHNTVLKMAKKRSYVDCAITAASASDLLEQDTINEEDMTLEDGATAGKNNREPNPKADIKPAPVKDTKAAQKPADNPATAQQPPDGEKELDVFDTLEKELAEFCDGDEAAMQDKLQALTSFPAMKKDKNGKYTKEPTGEIVPGMKFVSEMRMKGKTAWAGSALNKLREEVAGER